MEGDPLIQFFIPSMRVWILGEESRDQSLPADVVPLRSFFFFYPVSFCLREASSFEIYIYSFHFRSFDDFRPSIPFLSKGTN